MRTSALTHLISNLPGSLEAPTIVVTEVGSMVPVPEINIAAEPHSIIYIHMLCKYYMKSCMHEEKKLLKIRQIFF